MKTVRILLIAAMTCVIVYAAKPVSDPLEVTLFGLDVYSDTGAAYTHGIGGVHAILPGTGNIILDPDRNARGNQTPRSMLVDIPGFSPPSYEAFFMSINSVGYTCSGTADTTPARDLAANDCIQSELAINQIGGTSWFLICGGEFTDIGLTNVEVTCLSDNGNGCTEWDIASPGGAVSCALFEYQGKKKGQTLVQISAPFDIDFAAYVTHLGSP